MIVLRLFNLIIDNGTGQLHRSSDQFAKLKLKATHNFQNFCQHSTGLQSHKFETKTFLATAKSL